MFRLLLFLAAMPVWADPFFGARTFLSIRDSSPGQDKICEQSGASVSVLCTADDGRWVRGIATSETNLGPLGIGVRTDALVLYSNPIDGLGGIAEAHAEWDGWIIPEGGMGSGFMQLNWFAFLFGINVGGDIQARFDSTEICGFTGCIHDRIPIVYGHPYYLSIESSSVYTLDGAPKVELYLASADFFDSTGDPISGTLASVPESDAGLLFATVLFSLPVMRKHLSHPHGSASHHLAAKP